MYGNRVLLIAGRTSFFHVLLMMTLIGGPIVFFSSDLDIPGKLSIFLFFLISLWLVYFLLNILFHRRSLRNTEKLNEFLAKKEVEQGKDVGTYLEGW
ncbi:hypothetical protein EDC38_3142 [Marinimicrobium koreense]|uniref:Uncharacterized protein n=1 Tax=Marinimicrobium koreense TaxID=306545 RepID=A0A3N1NSK0_9GAMM|nr:hypothetical protein EDC38_3142 [Marinimicrobium koreense]